MPQEILVLAWGAALVIVQIFLAGHLKTKQYGADWNIGARDEPMPPLEPVPARARRAQDNMMETFPVAVAALLGVVVAGRSSDVSVIGAWLWLAMRVVYVPVYLLGIKGLRTAIFLVSMVGLLMVLVPLLGG
ncbi:MAPEG family protein [Novosphingobium malaysiense]|uniref:Membrane protein n=1 Tax=Novosphingobium malaysiense TaxID=1348853 RepID=A0A0B1ZPJ5_9SPHN|nr:MAPEG family protein [Novosphingobium malaysiense]KHK92516.1 membrane protein [Novosphingobium malaysiense]